MTTPVWISLGSNLGDRRAILDAAVQALSQTEGVVVSQVSTYRETTPVGGPPGQGAFLNAAARLDTTLSPRALLVETQRIETELGRVRAVRWGERTLDIDLLIYGCKTISEPDLWVPHPRLAVRRFVLEPLAEIAPQIVDMASRKRVDDLLANLDRSPRLVMIHESIGEVFRTRTDQVTSRLHASWVDVPVSKLPWLAQRAEVEAHIRSLTEAIDAIMDLLGQSVASSPKWIFADGIYNTASIVSRFSPPVRREAKFPHNLWLKLLSEWQLRSRIIASDIPAPILIIARTDAGTTPYDGLGWIAPIYWPEATEPDAIVAEVVAVCRGIAGL